MARVRLPAPERLAEEDAAQYERFPANLTRALCLGSGLAAHFLDLGFALRRTCLSHRHYEMVILRVAALSNSAYERMQHIAPARAAGWSDEDIDRIEGARWTELGRTDALVVQYVNECVANVRVSDETFRRLEAETGDRFVADLTLLIGFYMMTARYLESLAVDLDEKSNETLLLYEN